jgi:hypothetical protein
MNLTNPCSFRFSILQSGQAKYFGLMLHIGEEVLGTLPGSRNGRVLSLSVFLALKAPNSSPAESITVLSGSPMTM